MDTTEPLVVLADATLDERILLTSNRAPTEWQDLFGDPLLPSYLLSNLKTPLSCPLNTHESPVYQNFPPRVARISPVAASQTWTGWLPEPPFG